jgi:hypothetical protein
MGDLISSILTSFGIASAEKAAARLGSVLTEDALQSRPGLRAETERRYAAFLSALDARVARLEHEIGPAVREDLIRRLDDPGFVLLLNASSQAALAIDDKERHEVLAALVVQRALIDEATTRRLIAETATELIHKINLSHLATLGIKFFYHRDRPWLRDQEFSRNPEIVAGRHITSIMLKYQHRHVIRDREDIGYLSSLALLSQGGSGAMASDTQSALYLDLFEPVPNRERPDHSTVFQSDWFQNLVNFLGENLIRSDITATGALIGQYFHTEVLV